MITGSVDTNVLVRLITQDDLPQAQAQAIDQLLAHHARKGEMLLAPVTVVLELEWVLRSRLSQNKEQALATLDRLLTLVELTLESENAVEQALFDYREGPADFGQYLHLALARKEEALPFYTFDKKATRALGAQAL